MSRPVQILRVFTDGADGGNHLGVVNDVTGLDAAGMQRLATALGFSETIYIDWLAGSPFICPLSSSCCQSKMTSACVLSFVSSSTDR